MDIFLFYLSVIKNKSWRQTKMLKDQISKKESNKRYPIHEAFRISEREKKNIEIIMNEYDLESRSQTIRYAINHFALKEDV
jgi:hypothetical protein